MRLINRLCAASAIGVALVNLPSLPIFADGPVVGTSAIVELIQLDPLPGHQYSPVVTAMALDSNSQTLAAAGDDHAIRWIDLTTGKTLRTLEGHTDWVRKLKFLSSTSSTPLAPLRGEGLVVRGESSMILLSCGDDGKLLKWTWNADDPTTSVKTLVECNHTLTALAIDAAERNFATGGFSQDIHTGSLSDDKLRHTIQCDCGDQRTLVFSNDASKLFAGGRDGKLHCFNMADQTELYTQTPHKGRIRSIALDEQSATITSVGDDCVVARSEEQTGTLKLSTKLKSGKLLAVEQISRDQLVVASADNTLHIVDANTGEVIHKLSGHDGSVATIHFQNDQLITAGYDTTIRIWKMADLQPQSTSVKLIRHSVPGSFTDSGVDEVTN
jgi:WD40 repeat protein